MTISIIVAKAKNNVIGRENDLVWRLPADFMRFKALTTGHHLLMGRKTFESLGRPLPNRTHLVVSRDPDFKVPEGHYLFPTIEDAFTFCNKIEIDHLYIIGGGEIYKQTLNIADKLILTEVDTEPEGDTFFPEVDYSKWKEIFREFHPKDEKHEYSFSFIDYEKIEK
ncbi:dihydrofolate reductase [Algoriphagus sp. CAU 1675]|uniref:dihydrofolate reductase n=1 Tax=Algoriphagus sp. CAU 1675 TaxID=3032597 RepID=UPI0023DA0E03|nr:dihydrofolate reductase [Algoriphagus sp. CAU 1675]MDF2158070.1 dihydrofolate reductase [Algoriphagus sp. CAU 1675]